MTIDRAIQLAAKYHQGQADKLGEAYILHPLRVMLNVPAELRIPAVLHDILEDTTCPSEDLAPFGERVFELVERLTHRPNEPRPEYIARVLEDYDAAVIKWADIMDNMNRVPQLPNGDMRIRLLQKYARDLNQFEVAGYGDLLAASGVAGVARSS